MCRVSNRKCVRFVSSIPLKSMQGVKGTLRLRAYKQSLLQQYIHRGPCNMPAMYTVRLRFRRLTLHDLD